MRSREIRTAALCEIVRGILVPPGRSARICRLERGKSDPTIDRMTGCALRSSSKGCPKSTKARSRIGYDPDHALGDYHGISLQAAFGDVVGVSSYTKSGSLNGA